MAKPVQNYIHHHSESNCIVERSMLNGLQMNLKDAIESAGTYVPDSTCLWQYPEIIKDKLIAKTIKGVNLLGKDIINIYQTQDNEAVSYNISTIYDTKDINRPNYANSSDSWGEKLSVDNIFNDLFNNILPAVKGIHAGDMTSTDDLGNDTKIWNNTLFNSSGNKNNLEPNAKYLRLYLTCQAEPIYILIDSAISNTTGGYNIESSDTVLFDIDNKNMVLTAHINCITNEQINMIE